MAFICCHRYPVSVDGSVTFKSLMMDYGVNDDIPARLVLYILRSINVQQLLDEVLMVIFSRM